MHSSDRMTEKTAMTVTNAIKRIRQQDCVRLSLKSLIIDTMNRCNVCRFELARRMCKSKEYVTQLLDRERHPTTQEMSDVFLALGYSINFTVEKLPEEEEMSDWEGCETYLSLGQLIQKATEAAEESPLGLETAVCLCENGREFTPVVDSKLDGGLDEDGATFLVSLHKLQR